MKDAPTDPSVLIQLMRESPLNKVREYLDQQFKIALKHPEGKAADFYERFTTMFMICSISSHASPKDTTKN